MFSELLWTFKMSWLERYSPIFSCFFVHELESICNYICLRHRTGRNLLPCFQGVVFWSKKIWILSIRIWITLFQDLLIVMTQSVEMATPTVFVSMSSCRSSDTSTPQIHIFTNPEAQSFVLTRLQKLSDNHRWSNKYKWIISDLNVQALVVRQASPRAEAPLRSLNDFEEPNDVFSCQLLAKISTVQLALCLPKTTSIKSHRLTVSQVTTQRPVPLLMGDQWKGAATRNHRHKPK